MQRVLPPGGPTLEPGRRWQKCLELWTYTVSSDTGPYHPGMGQIVVKHYMPINGVKIRFYANFFYDMELNNEN